MKRILSLLMVVTLLIVMPVSALEWSQVDSDLDTVSISGNAPSGRRITVIVLNPNYTYEEYISSDASKRLDAIKYVGVCYAGSHGYELTPIRLDGAGTYTVLANGEKLQFEYFSKTAKVTAINRFNAGSDGAPELIETFGLKSNSLAAVESDYTSRVNSLRGDLNPADINGALDKIVEALIMAALDKGDGAVLYSGKTFNFAEEIGLTSSGTPTDEYTDYLSNLSNAGISKVKTAIKADMSSCLNLNDVKDTFDEYLYVNLIMNNKYNGAGHVQAAFEKYQAYSDYGINYPSSEDTVMYEGLLMSGADSMDDIKTYINNYTPENGGGQNNGYNTPGSLGGGGGFGGGSSGGGSGGYPAKPTTPEKPTEPGQNIPVDPITPPMGGGSYTDLPSSHWASNAFETLSKLNIINGYEDGTVRPDQEITRAEFAKMLVSLLSLDITDSNTGFADVPLADWSAVYVAAAAKAGLITGNNGNFNPTDIISRQDAAIILARAANLKAEGESGFADSDAIADYAKDAATAVWESGLMQGTGDGNFNPLGSMTRAQAAMVFYRLSEKGVK